MLRRFLSALGFVWLPWVALALFGAWMAGAGEPFKAWPSYMDYHELQAEGFLQGHLHLSWEPAPELLKQENPRDPAHRALWLWDASLHDGHYYLYWGPVPALLMAAVKWAFHIPWLGDPFAVYVFWLLALAASGALLWRLRAEHFPQVPRGWVTVLLLAVGFIGPVLHLVTTAAVYQAAIIGAQAFLVLGVALAARQAGNAAPPAGGTWRLWAAGLAFGLALACRITVAPAIAVIGLLTAWAVGRGDVRAAARALVAVAAPVAACLVAMLAYNQARFGKPLEFGITLQMSTIKFQPSFAYLPANLHGYALRNLAVDWCTFPYLLQRWDPPDSLPSWIHPPADYLVGEPLVGFLRSIPLSWLAVPAMLFVARSARRQDPPDKRRALWWWLGVGAALATATFAVPLMMFSATMRYLGDVAYGLCLMGALGAFALLASGRKRQGGAVVALVVLAQLVVGFAIGFQGYNNHFKLKRPELYAKLNRPLPWCATPPPAK